MDEDEIEKQINNELQGSYRQSNGEASYRSNNNNNNINNPNNQSNDSYKY